MFCPTVFYQPETAVFHSAVSTSAVIFKNRIHKINLQYSPSVIKLTILNKETFKFFFTFSQVF